MKEYPYNYQTWMPLRQTLEEHWIEALERHVYEDGYYFCFRPYTPGFINYGCSILPAIGFNNLLDLYKICELDTIEINRHELVILNKGKLVGFVNFNE